MGKVKRPMGTFIGVVVVSFALYFAMTYLQNLLAGVHIIPNYMDMQNAAAKNNPLGWIAWIIGDMTEANFYKSYLGGAGLIIGGFIAHYLYKKKSAYQGTAICYGSGLWPWIFAASLTSLLLSNLVYGWNIADSGWFPTFVVFVSVPAGTILVYGKGIKNLLTGAIAAVIIVVPLSRLVMVYFCTPLGLPSVAGSVFGMWAGGIVAFETFRLLPWMKLPVTDKEDSISETGQKTEADDSINEIEEKHKKPSAFFIKRIIADFSEPCFAGNEIVGACLLIGTVISWLLCPDLPVYGSGTFPAVLLSQLLTGAVAMIVYWDDWMKNAWFPTFPSMVSVAPGVAWLYGGNLVTVIIAAVLGGILCPAITNFVLKKLPAHWSSVVATTFSMSVCTVVVGMFIICIKGIIPGL